MVEFFGSRSTCGQRAGELLYLSGTIVFPVSIVHLYRYTLQFQAHEKEENSVMFLVVANC